MLTNISLDNFKSISTKTPIELRDYSIFCGANSSGKSSLIQALLMISQTFSARYDFDEVVLNGQFIRLGSFKDIKSHRSERNRIAVGFSMETSKLRRDAEKTLIEYEFVFGSRTKPYSLIDEDYHPAVLEAEIKLTHYVGGSTTSEYFKVERVDVPAVDRSERERDGHALLSVLAIDTPEMAALAKEYPEFRVVGCEANSFVPSALIIEYNYTKKIGPVILALITGQATPGLSKQEIASQPDSSIPKEFFIALNNFIVNERVEFFNSMRLPKELDGALKKLKKSDANVQALWRQLISSKFVLADFSLDPRFLISAEPVRIKDWLSYLGHLEEKTRKALTELMDKRRSELQAVWDLGARPEMRRTTVILKSFHYLGNYLGSYFSRSVKYLGPLRNEPQPVYVSLGHSDPKHVGLKGEFTAAVLHLNRFKHIVYPSPRGEVEGEFHCLEKTAPLQFALKEWLAYLGVISDYMTIDKGKLGYEIYVKIDSHDEWQDLTHVGVGVSQVLPIVLMFLLSEPGDLLVFEQPELHLHPKVQSRLSDFLTAMARSGRQCIIETHSEYLINRLRLRIAQSRDGCIEEMASVFFVTKIQGRSSFDRVAINRFGAILDWPPDFFDQTDREVEKILIEANKKRRIEKRNA